MSAKWVKTDGYLDTKAQDKINYIFVLPKKVEINDIPGDTGHFIRTEIDSSDFKNREFSLNSKEKQKQKTICFYSTNKKSR